jgi:hypothetical protein
VVVLPQHFITVPTLNLSILQMLRVMVLVLIMVLVMAVTVLSALHLAEQERYQLILNYHFFLLNGNVVRPV